MENTIRQLERSVKWLKLYGAVLTVAFVGLALFVGRASRIEDDGILRIKGLVIEDRAGRERVLIGAPIPPAGNRIRTDSARAREAWAKRYPPEYMDHYKGYRHDMNGILILGETGFDRIAIGDPTPDPNSGRRVGPGTGIAINDEQGFERTGYGLVRVKDRSRVTLGIDSNKGEEALLLTAGDDGGASLVIQKQDRQIHLGSAPAGDTLTGMPRSLFGLLLKEGSTVRHELNIATR